jgi:hypothetical protein
MDARQGAETLWRLILPQKWGDRMGLMEFIDRALTIMSIMLTICQINQDRQGK